MTRANGVKRVASALDSLSHTEHDKQQHLASVFLHQTPPDSGTSNPHRARLRVNDDFYESKGLWNDIRTLRWIRVPSSSFKLSLIPIILYGFCEGLAIRPNSFGSMLFISHPIAASAFDDIRYGKGWLDLAFIAYHIVVFSFIRQFLLLKVIRPVSVKLGIKKQKLDRFGEQAYAVIYYGTMGVWGIFIMRTLPTWWYRTEHFWVDYPHWDMKSRLKRYYLMHLSYWIQQLLILVLRMEKPRKDFRQLVAHHFVTLWLIGWSYGVNLTLIGNAVFVSMDIPDVFLAVTLPDLRLSQLIRTKITVFVVYFAFWTYFRIWLNIRILYSVLTEYDMMPDSSKRWAPADGVWMLWWMKYQIFVPLLLLLFLNLFWYYIMIRVARRAIKEGNTTDERSDDEDDGKDN